jgi:hypothetical protein
MRRTTSESAEDVDESGVSGVSSIDESDAPSSDKKVKKLSSRRNKALNKSTELVEDKRRATFFKRAESQSAMPVPGEQPKASAGDPADDSSGSGSQKARFGLVRMFSKEKGIHADSAADKDKGDQDSSEGKSSSTSQSVMPRFVKAKSKATSFEPTRPEKLANFLLSGEASFPSLYQLLAVAANSDVEKDLVNPLLDGMTRAGLLVPFLQYGIAEEVRTCVQESTLFREQSVVMSVFAALTKLPGSCAFMNGIISPVTDEIFTTAQKEGLSSAFAQLGTGSKTGSVCFGLVGARSFFDGGGFL